MNLSEAITGRRSVREYTAEAVTESAIARLIDAAIQAPSAVNQQPWTFAEVRDQGLLDLISRGAKAHMLATLEATTMPTISACGSVIRIFRSSIKGPH